MQLLLVLSQRLLSDCRLDVSLGCRQREKERRDDKVKSQERLWLLTRSLLLKALKKRNDGFFSVLMMIVITTRMLSLLRHTCEKKPAFACTSCIDRREWPIDDKEALITCKGTENILCISSLLVTKVSHQSNFFLFLLKLHTFFVDSRRLCRADDHNTQVFSDFSSLFTLSSPTPVSNLTQAPVWVVITNPSVKPHWSPSAKLPSTLRVV